ncbi:AaceriABR245Cp [[Ashbya] aceris (nom. inval.)]|nr:AaceriABR245Cp [[Ashbya] aceris (nom. inval.)]
MTYRRSLSLWRLRTIRVPLLLALLGAVSLLVVLSLKPQAWPAWPAQRAPEVPATPASQAPVVPVSQAPTAPEALSPAAPSPEAPSPAAPSPEAPSSEAPSSEAAAAAEPPKSEKEHYTPPSQEQCKEYFEGIYIREPSWANSVVRISDNVRATAKYTATLLERWRIFADCFISQNLRISDTLSGKIDMQDFHQRMFPFLAKKRHWRDIWPTVIDVNTGNVSVAGAVGEGHKPEIDENVSFWHNWRSASKGKGIVMTLGAGHMDLLLRLLTVLDHLGNELPIEIVDKGYELPREFIDKLADFVRTKSKQKVRIVSCARTLDETHARLFSGFMNKWIALIFNTFEEVVFLDADAVPYIAPERFLDMEGYKSTGMMLFRDRLINEFVPEECSEAVQQMAPTPEETTKWHHKAKFSGRAVNRAHLNHIDEGAATVYDMYVKDRRFHVVESGIVVLRKKHKIESLINSFMLHMNLRNHGCFYGDKELMWVGQLLSAEDYYVHPEPPAILGNAKELEHEGNTVRYQVCGTQIGHTDSDGSLLWTNGGLKRCKFTDAAEKDFNGNPDYFAKKYDSPQQLQDLYNKPLDIQMVFIPERSYATWEMTLECQLYTWCSTITVNPDKASEFKFVIMKDDQRLVHYNEISQLWNRPVS